MTKKSTKLEFDAQVDLLYSHIDKFVNDDSEGFSQDLIEYSNMAYMNGWADSNGWANAIDMVLNVIGSMYNEYDPTTLEELRQRIV